MSLNLTRERDLAAEWELSLEQFRLLRRRHQWAHVKFSRQDIRYTDEQITLIVHELTKRSSVRPKPQISGQTSRSKARSA